MLLVLFLAIYAGARMHLSWTRPNSDSPTRVSFTIPRGSSLSTIAEILEDKELVRDAWSFKMWARWKGLASDFQAGEYVIPRNLTFSELGDFLQHGKSEEIRVTIPEGSTVRQIDRILAKKALIEPGEFEECANFCDLGFRISSLEGFLFPSTYYVNPTTFSNKKFIQRLYRTFQSQIDEIRTDIQESGRTLEEVVIVASMIEREAYGDSFSEKQMIADVIWKRLDERIHLGIDATTRYELDEWQRPLYTEDFEKDSPYNTRRNLGLPPTAISNPGLDSLRAAANPIDTEYYYYLHDRSGQVHFGRTLDEHNANKRKYLY
ncbi:MAG: endolytic transglycosylase MltG [Candidatus Gracilibacteria bacterium]|nr:endolytic transglycosylase MltG [Candidatus Gracilibacteria bacterium]